MCGVPKYRRGVNPSKMMDARTSKRTQERTWNKDYENHREMPIEKEKGRYTVQVLRIMNLSS
jgi:hypothetical protein